MNFFQPDKNQYAYKLSGLKGSEDKWIYLGNKNFVDFTGIQPGLYALYVKGSNNDGVWNEKGIKLNIIVLAPFWHKLWFHLLIAAFILLIILIAVWIKVMNEKQQREKLTRMVNEQTMVN